MTGKILTGVISRRSRIAAVIASAVLAVFGSLAFTGTAGATTLTCTNIGGGIVIPGTPAGCGGLQSMWTGDGVLDIAADSNNNNAVVRVEADSSGNSAEDFTAYAVGGSVTGSIGDLGRYIAMFTPLGKVPSYTVITDPVKPSNDGLTFTNAVPDPGTTFTAGPTTHCISVVSENNGPRSAARWNAVLRNCSSNGVFKYGTGTAPGSITPGFGNAWQEWAPVAGTTGTGATYLELVNVWLFNHHNVQYTLNITGSGGAGTHLIAYPNSGGAQPNEEWNLIGCTAPGSTLGGGAYASCP